MRAADPCREPALLPRRGLGVIDDSVGVDDDLPPGLADPPAEIEVIPHERQVAVESAQCFPDIPPDQHAGTAHCEHPPLTVVLALVLLATIQPGLAAPRPRHGQPGF